VKPVALRDEEVRTLAQTGECEIIRKAKPQPRKQLIESIDLGFLREYDTYYWRGRPYECLTDLIRACPLCQVGEKRWVKEKWGPDIVTGYLRPAITMPRRASKSTVEILSVEMFERESEWYWRARVRRYNE